MQLSYYQHHRLFCTVNWCPCVYFRIKLNVCSRLNKKSIYVNVHVSSIFRSPDELEFLLWNPVGSQVTCICASPVSNSGITIIDTSHLIFLSLYDQHTIGGQFIVMVCVNANSVIISMNKTLLLTSETTSICDIHGYHVNFWYGINTSTIQSNRRIWNGFDVVGNNIAGYSFFFKLLSRNPKSH